MAVGQHNSASFYSITNGKICRQFQSPTPNSVTRVNKNSKTVHEEFYDYISGRITDIKVQDHQEYGKRWAITLSDEEGNSILQMKYGSGYATAFLKTLPNVDLSSEVKLAPKLTVEGDKKKTSLFVMQHGHALKHYYTKDSPNGLPQLEQKKVKGKTVWDDSEQSAFLEDMVNTRIVPQLSGAGTAAVAAGPVGDDEPSDELPL